MMMGILIKNERLNKRMCALNGVDVALRSLMIRNLNCRSIRSFDWMWQRCFRMLELNLSCCQKWMCGCLWNDLESHCCCCLRGMCLLWWGILWGSVEFGEMYRNIFAFGKVVDIYIYILVFIWEVWIYTLLMYLAIP